MFSFIITLTIISVKLYFENKKFHFCDVVTELISKMIYTVINEDDIKMILIEFRRFLIC